VSLTSPLFYIALIPAVAFFYFLPGPWRAAYLLALSYAFYALSSPLYLILLVIASAAVYAIGLAIAKSHNDRTKQAYMAAGVAALIAIVVAFKAAGAWSGFLLPLGVSYYSFKLISYLIEVYWDEEAVERDPAIFFLFPAFFPQIVSGPIQRPEPFFDQMRSVAGKTFDFDQLEMGFRLILGGLMMKLMVADRLAAFIEPIDKSHADYSYSILLTTADFAGYTNIALGIGKLFRIDGPPNFNAPFAAVNIQEMWRRWHMSLTTWVTDYMFTPLSMSLRDLGQTGLVLCIMLNMVIIGLWHGLTLNFLVFGLMHGVFVAATALVVMARRRRRRGAKPASGAAWPAALGGMILTFALMSFSQIFWHSPTWDQATSILAQITGIAPSGPSGWSDMPVSLAVSAWICMGIALYVGAGAPGARAFSQRISSIAPQWLQYAFCLLLLWVFSIPGSGRFVYQQF
jgi:alginate O-acetyltransferase complex protein AlgI